MVARRLLKIVLALGWLVLCGTNALTATAQGRNAYAVIEAVNRLRASRGLAALQIDPALMTAAQRHADWMAATRNYGHTGEGGSSPQGRAVAAGYRGTVYENYEGGTNLTPEGAVYWWERSPIHLTTMLLPRHVHVGAGYAQNNSQGLYVLLVGLPSPPAKPTRTGTPAPTDTPAPIVIPIVVSTPGPDGSVVHVVQQGQTLWAIAARYGVAVAELRALNFLGNGSLVQPGDKLVVRLAEGQAPPPTPTVPTVHTVQKGETAWTIAARYGLTLDELLNLNGITREKVLLPGDQLLIRRPEPTSTQPVPTEVAAASTPISTTSPAPTVVVPSPSPIAATQPAPTATPTPTPAAAPDTPAQDPRRQIAAIGAVAGVAFLVLLTISIVVMRRRL
jgi:LysM repeat protein